MKDLDNTLTTQLFAQDGGAATALLGLTILWHPQAERIAEQFIGPPGEGAIDVCRYLPLFFHAGEGGAPIGHRAVARAPLRLTRTAGDSVEITAPDSCMAVEVNGRVLAGAMTLTRAQVAHGVVLGLGGHVLLCLHWMTSLPRPNHLPGLLGVSSGAISVRELIRQVAPTELPVLLLGETGTGKDVAARAIHATSRRAARALVAVNMATLNESLAAADLFGALKGAYTGAQSQRNGLFAEADGGTLFLDELGDTPGSVQPMLLRVLETGRYRPLGAGADAVTTARLIAATDQDLDTQGFNQPLLRRMEAFVIRMPALRERREDVGLLLLHALRDCGASAAEMADFPPALVSEMCTYDWPGNIRQLYNVTRRALMAVRAGQPAALIQFIRALQPAPAHDAPARPLRGASGRRRLAELSHADVLTALEDNSWQISGAAQQLGISRPSLYKLIEINPGIRAAALIPPTEIAAALAAHGSDLERCASYLRTPSEALRRHLRVLGTNGAA